MLLRKTLPLAVWPAAVLLIALGVGSGLRWVRADAVDQVPLPDRAGWPNPLVREVRLQYELTPAALARHLEVDFTPDQAVSSIAESNSGVDELLDGAVGYAGFQGPSYCRGFYGRSTGDSLTEADGGHLEADASIPRSEAIRGTSLELCFPPLFEPAPVTKVELRIPSREVVSIDPPPDSLERAEGTTIASWNERPSTLLRARLHPSEIASLQSVPGLHPSGLLDRGLPDSLVAILFGIGFGLVPAGIVSSLAHRIKGLRRNQRDLCVSGIAVTAAVAIVASPWLGIAVQELDNGLTYRSLIEHAERLALFALATSTATVTLGLLLRPTTLRNVGNGLVIAAVVNVALFGSIPLAIRLDLHQDQIRAGVWLLGGFVLWAAFVALIRPAPERLISAETRLAMYIGAAGLALFLATASEPTGIAQAPEGEIRSGVSSFISTLSTAVPILLAVATVLPVRSLWNGAAWEQIAGLSEERVLSPMAETTQRERFALDLIAALFAIFVVGTGWAVLGIPISLFLALGLFPLLLASRADTQLLAALAPRIRELRPGLVRQLVSTREGRPAREEPSAREELIKAKHALALGPSSSPYANARLGAGVAAVLGLIPLVIYLVAFLPGHNIESDPRVRLLVALNLLGILVDWAITGFAFGAAYEFLPQPTGLRKGLWFAGAAALLTGPFRLLYVLGGLVSPVTALVGVIELLAILGAIGLLFDLVTIERTGNLRQGLRPTIAALAESSGVRPVFTLSAAVLAAIGLVVQQLLTGQLSQLVTRSATPILPFPSQ